MKELISVITPVKNILRDGRGEWFQKMIESLYHQTYTHFEHIVVDGGSNDGTQELLEEHKKKGNIDVYISRPDKNVQEAMNTGLRQMRGSVVHVMNSDNFITIPNFFERSLATLDEQNMDFTHANRLVIHQDGSSNNIKCGDVREAFFRMPFRFQTMLIRKSVFDELGFFDESYIIAGDYKFMMQMILANKRGHHFPEVFISSRDGGITKNRLLCIDEVTRVLYEIYGRQYGLTQEECRAIYLRRISPELYTKITSNIPHQEILDSLKYCYEELNEF